MINRLKYNSFAKGANTIINIKVTNVNRETGNFNNPKTKRIYLTTVYANLVVRMHSDSLFKSGKFGDWQNEDYKKEVAEYQRRENNQFMAKFVLGTVGLIFCIAYLIAKA